MAQETAPKTEYFDNLNYTLSNEDTRIENYLLPDGASRVFSICGSGARVLPLIAKNPKELDCVDLAREQLFLCELRLAAAKKLSHDEYLFFLGYRGGIPSMTTTEDNRVEIFNTLELSDVTKKFWSDRSAAWAPRGFVLLGKWESHFQKLGRIFRNYLRLDMSPIFEAHSLSEQLELFEEHWKPFVFSTFLKLTANEFVFNRFLYKGHFAGASERRTESRPPYQFIEEEFTRIFTTTLVRKNYFMQLLFLGGIYYEEGLPIEAHAKTLEAIRKSKTKVNYRQENLLEVLKGSAYEFISLSDTISYLPNEAAGQVLQLLPSATPKGAQMVIRSFLRAPTEIDTKGWKAEPEKNRWAREIDTTAVYEFHIFTKK
jgi:S-adenosylmethionine-diacylglycerol 3-amino-3-carboxypropyl transferase